MFFPAFRTRLPSMKLRMFLMVGLFAGSALHSAEHTVMTDGVSFVPASLTIQVGDTVTWINADNGLHNVVADDGTFDSGDPSTASWQYSFTFHQGGTWDYSCEIHVDQGMVGTITVEGIFGDGVESGGLEAWSNESPGLPNCHCYFSGDCAGVGEFCNWGILTQENNCLWRENKPNGVPGAGCDVDYPGTDWIGGICDGICTLSSFGSALGLEDRNLVAQGAQLWGEALLRPAVAGGGEIDPGLSQQALGLPFEGGEHTAWILGRQIGDLLGNLGVEGLDHQYCHHESHPGEPSPTLPDVSDDVCMATAARLAMEALVAEMYEPGSGLRILADLADCGDGSLHLFEDRCPAGKENLKCAARRIASSAEFLTTPPNAGPSWNQRQQ